MDPADVNSYYPMCRRHHIEYDMTPEWRAKMEAGKRANIVRGENHGRVKLTGLDVVEIRQMYASGEWSMPALSKLFGVHTSQIHRIIKRKQWTSKEKK